MLKGYDRVVVSRADQLPDEAALAARFGAVNVTRVEPTWSERMVSVMTSMWVRGVLIAIFLVAAFVELIAPGFGFPGLVALGALALLFGPPALVGAAAWWARRRSNMACPSTPSASVSKSTTSPRSTLGNLQPLSPVSKNEARTRPRTARSPDFRICRLHQPIRILQRSP